MSHGAYPVLSVQPGSVNDATKQRKVGSKYSHYDATYGWRTVEYVYLDDAVDAILGSVAVLSDLGLGNVTCDVSGGSAVAGLPFAGLFLGSVTAGRYGFIVCGLGDRAFCSTGGSVAAASLVVVDASNDKLGVAWAPTSVDPTVAQLKQGKISVVGYMIAADGSTGGPVILTQGGLA